MLPCVATESSREFCCNVFLTPKLNATAVFDSQETPRTFSRPNGCANLDHAEHEGEDALEVGLEVLVGRDAVNDLENQLPQLLKNDAVLLISTSTDLEKLPEIIFALTHDLKLVPHLAVLLSDELWFSILQQFEEYAHGILQELAVVRRTLHRLEVKTMFCAA